MKRRLVLFVVSLSLLISLSAISYGGHILGGARTVCPGECTPGGTCSVCGMPCDYTVQAVNQGEDSGHEVAAPTPTDSDELGPALMAALLFALVWARLRA